MTTIYLIEKTEFDARRPGSRTSRDRTFTSVEDVTDYFDEIQDDLSRYGDWGVLRGADVLIATAPSGYTSVRRAVETTR